MPASRWPEVQEKLMLVAAWARDGLIDEQIAKNLGISYSTFNLYKKEHSELLNALKKNKEIADIEVENALFKRAKGYSYTETTTERKMGSDGEYHLTITKQVVKDVPPDVTAQIFWLKNRKPNDWRDKKEMDVTGKVVMFEDVDLDE